MNPHLVLLLLRFLFPHLNATQRVPCVVEFTFEIAPVSSPPYPPHLLLLCPAGSGNRVCTTIYCAVAKQVPCHSFVQVKYGIDLADYTRIDILKCLPPCEPIGPIWSQVQVWAALLLQIYCTIVRSTQKERNNIHGHQCQMQKSFLLSLLVLLLLTLNPTTTDDQSAGEEILNI